MEYSDEKKECVSNRLSDKIERILDKAEKYGVDLNKLFGVTEEVIEEPVVEEVVEEEIETPTYDTSSPEAFIRSQRDDKLREADIIVMRHREEKEFGVKPTLSPPQYHLLLRYKQLLRKVPEQSGFPNNIDWPDAPF